VPGLRQHGDEKSSDSPTRLSTIGAIVPSPSNGRAPSKRTDTDESLIWEFGSLLPLNLLQANVFGPAEVEVPKSGANGVVIAQDQSRGSCEFTPKCSALLRPTSASSAAGHCPAARAPIRASLASPLCSQHDNAGTSTSELSVAPLASTPRISLSPGARTAGS
jgi:hypothetical protein